MRTEYRNRATTTLAANYQDGVDDTITVTSATDFPSTGQFFVRLGNTPGTLLRVTAVAGAVFSIVSEAFPDDATSGQDVDLVVTRGALEAMWPVRGNPLDQSGFTWVNQGGAAVTQAAGIVYFEVPSQTTDIRMRVITAPATPYSFTIKLRTRARADSAQYAGVVLRESGTGKLMIFYGLGSSQEVQAVKFNSPTSFNSVLASVVMKGVPFVEHWLRVTDDGADIIFAASVDGENFFDYATEARTTFLTGGADQVGFFANVDGSNGEMAASIFAGDLA